MITLVTEELEALHAARLLGIDADIPGIRKGSLNIIDSWTIWQPMRANVAAVPVRFQIDLYGFGALVRKSSQQLYCYTYMDRTAYPRRVDALF